MGSFSQVLQDPWIWFAADVTIKVTVILMLAAGFTVATNSLSAAGRHRIWSLAFAGLVLLPLVQLGTPGLLWQTIPRTWQAAPAASSDLAPADRSTERMASGTSPPARQLLAHEPVRETVGVFATDRSRVSPAGDVPRFTAGDQSSVITSVLLPSNREIRRMVNWLLVVWGAGALVALAPLVTGLILNAQLKRRCHPLADAAIGRRINALGKRIELVRLPTVLLGDDEQMPMTFGLRHAYIVLPASALQWSPHRFDSVVLHELAHIRRFDVSLQLVARVACAMYWFHPLVWWSIGKMRLARELACDDCVLTSGQEPSDYAAELLDIARACRTEALHTTAALSMARTSQLEGRLVAVLDSTRRRAPVGSVRAVTWSVITIGIVATLAVVRPAFEVDAAPRSTESSARDAVNEGQVCLVTGLVLTPDGEPASAARIEVIAHDNKGGWDRHSPDELDVDRFESQTDAAGRFQIELPRDVSRPRRSVKIVANMEASFPAIGYVDSRVPYADMELQLLATRQVRVQLIDPIGNPLSDVVPQIRFVSLGGNEYLGAPHPDGHAVTKVWPTFSLSDEQGYTVAELPLTTDEVTLVINDERVGSHLVRVKVADKPVSAVLDTPTFVSGEVVDPDGAPVAGVELIVMEQPYRVVRTDSEGRFRTARGTTIDTLFPGGQSIVHVYPPVGSDLLFQAIEWEWPNDGFGDAELNIEMERGIVIEGRVVESGTGEPIEGARLLFEPQVKNNPHFKESYRSRFTGADMRYTTDSDGRFRMPVCAGPGHLLVDARTLDYIPVETSMGDMWYGEPGLQREYYDGLKRLELEQGSIPEPVTIELTRGETLHCDVVRPDGSPAEGKAFAASYMQDKDDINGWLPDIPLTDGKLDVPGFDPRRSTPLFIVDVENDCGAVVSPASGHVNPNATTIELLPCGAAKFRFVNHRGEPLADYQPQIHLVFKAGAPNTHHIQPDQPLWSDTIIWDNVVRPKKLPKTDADGSVIVDGLIPGADYNLYYVNKDGSWDEGYAFTIRSGETADVGEVVLYQRD